MRHSTIFKSRWMALLWAAGILWIAYDVAAPTESANETSNQATDASGEPVTAADAQTVGEVVNQL
ncbi:MAG: hypothetical protein ABIQ32_11410 [Sphingomicrobium sp.]